MPQITVAQYLAGKPFNQNPEYVLVDTGANIASLSAEEFGLLADNGVDRLNATDDTLTLSAAQYLAMAPHLPAGSAMLTLSNQDVVTLADTGATLASMTVEQFGALNMNGIDVLDATDDVMSLSTAQVLALGGTTLTAGDFITHLDTRGNIEALSAGTIGALEGIGIDVIDSTNDFLVLTQAQYEALGSVALTQADAVRIDVDGDYTLGDDVDNLLLLGDGNWNGTGNSGNNNLTGNSGNNILDGAGGADVMRGGLGDDTYITDGGDIIRENVDAGYDTVISSVSYKIRANLEALELSGTENINAMGNTVDNAITGNDGDNRLVGGMGQDVLTGGLGADKFVFTKASETGNTEETADEITDFSRDEDDLIVVGVIDADTTTDGNQAFTFIGEDAFSETAGELRFEHQGGKFYVYGDTDGDGTANFAIHLHQNGNDTLLATDFVL